MPRRLHQIPAADARGKLPWKLIHYFADHQDELHHLADDPGERNNLADRYPERTRSLQAQLFRWLQVTRN